MPKGPRGPFVDSCWLGARRSGVYFFFELAAFLVAAFLPPFMPFS
jgi:hypothetical protein